MQTQNLSLESQGSILKICRSHPIFHYRALFHSYKTAEQVLWIVSCFLLAMYHSYRAWRDGDTNFCGLVYFAQLWVMSEGLQELGVLFDYDFVQFKCEMAKFLFYTQIHFELLKLSR